MSDRKVRVDRIAAEYFRKGKCEICGKQCERIKTFTGTTVKATQDRADRWAKEPLMHAKCEKTLEGMNLMDQHHHPEHRDVETADPL